MLLPLYFAAAVLSAARFAVGALLAGGRGCLGHQPAIWAVAALTAASGIVVMVRMYETHPRHDRVTVLDDADLES